MRSNTMYNSNDEWHIEGIWVWGDTYGFRKWFIYGQEPGNAWYVEDVATTRPASALEAPARIGKAYVWDSSTTCMFKSQEVTLAEYLKLQFGFVVIEHDDEIWDANANGNNTEAGLGVDEDDTLFDTLYGPP